MATKPAKPVSTGAFKRGKALALPTLSTKSMKEGDSIRVEIVAPPVTKLQLGKGNQPKLDPDTGEPLQITICQARDLDRGVTGEIVLGFVVAKSLAEFYPKPEDMVGKKFEFLKGEKRNRTVLWEVYELEEA